MSQQPSLFGDLYRQASPKVVAEECRNEAQEAIRSVKTDLHRQVLVSLAEHGSQTSEELERSTGMGGSTLRPRLLELLAAGRVRRTGQRRPTRSGRFAAVWGLP